MSYQPTRRDVMKMLGAGAVAASIPLALSGCQPLPPWANIEALGNLYLTKHPEITSQANLAAALGNPNASAAPDVLLKRLSGQIKTEFSSGQVEQITGVIFSNTQWKIAAWWALWKRDHPTTTTTSTTTTIS